MKTLSNKLMATVVATGLFLTAGANATETGNAEQVTKALLAQQNQTVSVQLAEQVNQDIQFALRAVQMPELTVNKGMLAKADAVKSTESRGE